MLKKVYAAALEIIKQEAQNSETPVPSTTKDYRAISVTSLGGQFCMAQHGSTLLLATQNKDITRAIDQLLDGKADSILEHSHFILTERPQSADVLTWGWLDVGYFKSQAKEDIEKFKLPTNDLLPHLLFGGILDAIIRSDHAWFAFRADARGPVLELTSPAGRSKSQEGALGSFTCTTLKRNRCFPFSILPAPSPVPVSTGTSPPSGNSGTSSIKKARSQGV